ncbi:phage Gp37/Gp68 family protein [Desulfosporosinus sp. BG]|uniref:DUF5131 family protein n=1 Tax=Desulfosporosinus sp. BG TaxID=1633135 RepID=UPI00083B8C99|nr:phage Gp37/Gp68 family protein [Desulfosporosinus sp. BG]ODA40138.1 Bacteriophage protein [Desulfosporosinus sp. BG]
MAAITSIEWTEASWNPATGCTKVSAGCKNCYACTMAKRLLAMQNPRYANGFNVTLHSDLLDLPLKWKKPRKIFVNSMSDLFHESIPTEFIEKVFFTMQQASWHTFQILTKRAERLAELSPSLKWPSNVWQGVTVENDDVTNRIDFLRETGAKIKFLSCEPLIGPLDNIDLTNIDWVIVGGESGPKARPVKEEWIKSIRDQCQTSNTAFFFKQWGGVQKYKTGRLLEGRLWDEYPRSALQYNFAK